jgi:hypothetical protein
VKLRIIDSAKLLMKFSRQARWIFGPSGLMIFSAELYSDYVKFTDGQEWEEAAKTTAFRIRQGAASTKNRFRYNQPQRSQA